MCSQCREETGISESSEVPNIADIATAISQCWESLGGGSMAS